MAHIVIIDGGFGGLSAAKALRHARVPVTLLDRRGRVRFSGSIAWFQWLFLHIFMLIGFRNRLSVLLQWGAAYLTFQRSVRLITGTTDSQGASLSGSPRKP